MVDGGSLENCCTATYRGFESLRLRKNSHLLLQVLFLWRLRDSRFAQFPFRYPYPKPLPSGKGLRLRRGGAGLQALSLCSECSGV